MKKRLGKKLLGIGVPGFAFLGGAGFGFGVGLLSYSIYHRYQYIALQMVQRGFWDESKWNPEYYRTYYEKNKCIYGCPKNSHCEWGFCECDKDYQKFQGKCYTQVTATMMQSQQSNWTLDDELCCSSPEHCWSHDINSICESTNNSTSSHCENKCKCRVGSEFNTKAEECQIKLEIDCGKISYDSPVSEPVKAAAEIALKGKMKPGPEYTSDDIGHQIYQYLKHERELRENPELAYAIKPLSRQFSSNKTDVNRTETPQESISTSMLQYLDKSNTTEQQLEEAFCRDIDAFNSLFVLDDGNRPPDCAEVPKEYCAVLYDSRDCTGGWTLNITDGAEKNLYYFSSDWKYRNDVDTIGLRYGCTFTGFTSTGFSGNKMTLTAGPTDRWVILEKEEAYKHFHEDIEAFQCFCRH